MNNHDKIKEIISGLIHRSGFNPEEITITYDENLNTLWFSIESPNSRFLLGREAEALSSLNHLASKIVENIFKDETMPAGGHPRVVLDANGFERKKIDSLKTVAHMMAERARYFKSSIDVEPMSPRDRRIVHEFLSTLPDIKTESVGEGPKRHIVIRYVDSKI